MLPLATNKPYLWAELFTLFVGIPLILLASVAPQMPRWPKFAILWVAAVMVLHYLHKQPGFSWRRLWHGHKVSDRRLWQRLGLLALCCVPLTLIAWKLVPDRLFWLPRERPEFLVVIVVLYPLLSALPQEIIYRSFFFRRYALLFGEGTGMIACSAAAFGFVHVMFGNFVSPLLSMIGGLVFAKGYSDDHSLKWATIEHGLYGCAVFIIGLGTYFIFPR